MIERDIRVLTQQVVGQNEVVPYFKETDDAEKIALMIVEEAQELKDELQKAFITDDMTQVAGELGDVLYLALKMAHTLGLEAQDVIQMKILRNKMKYGGHTNKDVAKKEWEEMGGDKLWYQLYLETLAVIED